MSSASDPAKPLLFTTSALSGEMHTRQSLRTSAMLLIRCNATVWLASPAMINATSISSEDLNLLYAVMYSQSVGWLPSVPLSNDAFTTSVPPLNVEDAALPAPVLTLAWSFHQKYADWLFRTSL